MDINIELKELLVLLEQLQSSATVFIRYFSFSEGEMELSFSVSQREREGKVAEEKIREVLRQFPSRWVTVSKGMSFDDGIEYEIRFHRLPCCPISTSTEVKDKYDSLFLVISQFWGYPYPINIQLEERSIVLFILSFHMPNPRMLAKKIIALLDEEGLSYCIQNGYERYISPQEKEILYSKERDQGIVISLG